MILLLTQDDTVNLSKFISREQLAPTAAYHLIHQQVIAPCTIITRLIAAGPAAKPVIRNDPHTTPCWVRCSLSVRA
ncbi:putative DNA-binding transcriptional regulator [Klebsiella pneumoniae]|nr:putative DNA-binding transcriptional regulator [Klebsiella pneumoniae]